MNISEHNLNSTSDININSLLDKWVALGASDIHITENAKVRIRLQGELQEGDDALDTFQVRSLVEQMTNAVQRELFDAQGSLDFGYSCNQGRRFRANVYKQMGRTAIAIRHLNEHFFSLDELQLPAILHDLIQMKSGLVLITGATGSGKSTTLAAMLNELNQKRSMHIITIEDPIEFVYENKKALIHQRELHTDVPDFASAVRASLREDPDVIMVGEMRDLETIRAALTAAETGHLVFSTLHTSDAVGVIERLVGSFPGNEQDVARSRIGLTLKAVVAQHLIPTANHSSRIPAVELLIVNNAVANMIDQDKARQIYGLMEGGRAEGMQTFDQALASLVRDRWVTREVAKTYARNKITFDKLVSQPNSASTLGRRGV
ncbi:MAG: PilT/PilU family type 4a pilus ATPase [Pseudomonadales bacterium]|nr:PilT/PilU family type 4a pilus ATPase [Pseudomonadales bacterium]